MTPAPGHGHKRKNLGQRRVSLIHVCVPYALMYCDSDIVHQDRELRDSELQGHKLKVRWLVNYLHFAGMTSSVTLVFWVLFTSNTPSSHPHITAREQNYIVGSLKGQVSQDKPKVFHS